MNTITSYKTGFLANTYHINFLTQDQLNNLVATFQSWYDDPSISDTKRRIRGRYWLVFLTLRYTGARISEVTSIEYEDIDFRNAEIKVITLKRHKAKDENDKKRKKKDLYRIIPVPANLTAEIASYIAEYPYMREIRSSS